MTNSLTDVIHKYIAVTSVGASTVRGSPKGTVDISREFLYGLSLKKFGVKREKLFLKNLDVATEELKRKLPKGRRDWALSRKIINIFLHNAFYNYYLRERYDLVNSEMFFEVPMDSAVAKGLRRGFKRGTFSAWQGLKRLKKSEHDEYQRYAKLLAVEKGLSRVHMDALLWVQER